MSVTMCTRMWTLSSLLLISVIASNLLFANVSSLERHISELPLPNGAINKYDISQYIQQSETNRCNVNEFECTSNHLCIPATQVQDGVDDCLDGSDEQCLSEQHRCRCGRPVCLDQRFVGDGVRDCQDGSDEGERGSCPEGRALQHLQRRRRDNGHVQPYIAATKVQHSELVTANLNPSLNIDEDYSFGSLSSGHDYQSRNRKRVSQQIFNKHRFKQINGDTRNTPVKMDNPFVELTGTFVPFERLSDVHGATPINYYSSAGHSKDVEPNVIEITGTLVPEFGSPISASSISSVTDNSIIATVQPNPSEKTNDFVTITGTKGSFVTASTTFNVITGTYVHDKSSYAFFFGNRKIVPTSVASNAGSTKTDEDGSFVIYDTDLYHDDGSVLVELNNGELGILLPSSVRDAMREKTNEKLLFAKTERDGQIIRGIFVKGAKNVTVTGAEHTNYTTATDAQKVSILTITLSKTKPNNVLIKSKTKQTPIPKPTKSRKYVSMVFTDREINAIRNEKKIEMTDSIVGRKIEDGTISILTDQFILPQHMHTDTHTNMFTQTIGVNDYYPKVNKDYGESHKVTPPLNDETLINAPVYTHSKAKTEPIVETKQKQSNTVHEKITIFGFIDFTTNINGTDVIFTPTTATGLTQQGSAIRVPNLRPVSQILSQYQTNSEIRPLFLTSTREFVSQNSITTTTVLATATMAKSMFTSTIADSRRRFGKESEDGTESSFDSTIQSQSMTIDEKSEFSSLLFKSDSSFPSSVEPTAAMPLPTGLLSSITGSHADRGTTTEWTTLIIGTFIKGTYAHILQSTSSIYAQKKSTDEHSIQPTKTIKIPLIVKSTKFGSELFRDNDKIKPLTVSKLRSRILVSSILIQPSVSDAVIASGNLIHVNSRFTHPEIHILPTLKSSDGVTITNDFILPISSHRLKEHLLSEEADKHVSVNAPVNSQIEKLMTYYTTFTLYTTLVKDGSTVISANKETVTNIVTPTEVSSPQSTTTAAKPKPTTFYTRYTYFTTTVRNGETTVNSRIETVSNVIYGTIKKTDVVEELMPTKPSPTTYYTTYTYFTTFKKGGSEFVKSREEIVTNVVGNSPDESVRPALSTPKIETTLEPSLHFVTYYTTYTFLSTLVNNGQTTISTSKSTTSNVIAPSVDKRFASVSENKIQPTKTLEYTTITYFTTHYKDGTQSIDSRTSVITDTLIANDPSSDPSSDSNLRSQIDYMQLYSPTPALEGSLLSSINIKKLLSGLAVPITHYTTFTFFTTFFRDDTSSILSRTHTVSNVVTGTINLGPISGTLKTTLPSDDRTANAIDGTVSKHILDAELETAAAENVNVIYTPITYYTTTTHYSTYLIPGKGPTVISSTEVLSSVTLPGPFEALPVPVTNIPQMFGSMGPYLTERHEGRIIHSTVDERIRPTVAPIVPHSGRPDTVYTTYTYYTTRLHQNRPIVETSFETVSNIITKTVTVTDDKRPVIETSLKDPHSQAYKTIFTYYTTRYSNGTAFVTENKETVANSVPNTAIAENGDNSRPGRVRKPIIVTRTRVAGNDFTPVHNGGSRRPVMIIRRPQRPVHSDAPQPTFARNDDLIHVNSHQSDTGRQITPTPVTFFTTYTYFTTELSNGNPVIKSREEIFSTVITGKILPTRVYTTIQTPVFRHKRSLLFYENNGEDSYQSTNEPTHIDGNGYGYGYEINDQLMGDKNIRYENSNIEERDFDTHKLSSTIDPFMELYSSELIPSKFIIGTKSGHSTILLPDLRATFINGFDTHVEPNKTLLRDMIFPTHIEKPLDTSLSLDAYSEVASLEQMPVILSFLSAPSTSTPSLSSSSVTASDTASVAASVTASTTASSTSSSATRESKTGLISSITRSIVFGDRTTNVITEIYGTYVNGVYAHLAKTRTQILSIPATLTITPETTSIATSTSTTPSNTNMVLMTMVMAPLINPEVNQSAALLPQTNQIRHSNVNGIIENIIVSKNPETPIKSLAETLSSGSITRTLRTAINAGKTTIYTTDIFATMISGLLAHIGQVNSTIVEPWTSLPGLASVSTSTEIGSNATTVHTTEYYTTNVNGFQAHYSRRTSNVIEQISQTSEPIVTTQLMNKTSETIKSSTVRPFIHFPTPVRARLISKLLKTTMTSMSLEPTPTSSTLTSTITQTAYTITTTITATVNAIDSNQRTHPLRENDKVLYDNEDQNDYDANYADEYYDETGHSEEHTPRSRPIREKDSQPLADYGNDYADTQPVQGVPAPNPQQSPAQQYPPLPDQHDYTNPFRQSLNNQRTPISTFSRNNARQTPVTSITSRQQSNVQNARQQSTGGFGQRVSSRNQPFQPAYQQPQLPPEPQSVPQDYPRRFQIPEVNTQVPRVITQQPRVVPTPTRVRRPLSGTNQYTRGYENNYNGATTTTLRLPNDGRFVNRGNQGVLRPRMRTTTTTTTQRPQTVLPSRRRLNRKNLGRPRLTGVARDDNNYDDSRERNGRRRTMQRGRATKTTLLFLNNPTTMNTQQFTQTSLASSATAQLPKIPITVTSVVTTVRTIPIIFNGHKTSYATLTTTTLNSSVIQPGQYQTIVNPTNGYTKTVYSRISDASDPSKLTEVLITSTELQEIKLVPIRIGFSTRTETITEYQTFTKLTTAVTSILPPASIYLPPPQLPFLQHPVRGIPFSLITTTDSFVTTETITSTTVVSILLRGKTLLSTLTRTLFSSGTVTTTQTISIPFTQPAPLPVHAQPITTLLTFSLTGDSGDVTELVTAVTVPVQPIFHTKVERDVKATKSSVPLQQTLLPLPCYLTPIGAETEFISASFNTVDQIMHHTDKFFVATIFKGPDTEIYQASATIVQRDHDFIDQNEAIDDKYTTTFRKRKLQQFQNDNLGFGFGPQPIRIRDYARLQPQNHNSPGFNSDQTDAFANFPELDNPALLQSLPQNGRPIFQRIRLNSPAASFAPQFQVQPVAPQPQLQQPQSQPQELSSPNEPDSHRFQRIASPQRRPDTTPIRVTSQNGFRRVPIFSNPQSLHPQPQPQPLPQPQSLPSIRGNINNNEPQFVREVFRPSLTDSTTETPRESVTAAPLPVTPQNEGVRQTFRRIRPTQVNGQNGVNGLNALNGQNGRRRPGVRVSSRIPLSPVTSISVESTAEVLFSPLIDGDDIPRRIIPSKTESPAPVETPLTSAFNRDTTEQPRRIVRIRRPSTQTVPTRRRVILRRPPSDPINNELQPRGPVSAADDEPTRNNALDDDVTVNNEYGTRISDNLVITKNDDPQVLTPTIPLTYFTTFTYMTTVVRGQHTAHITRETVTSSIATEALDRSIIELIQNNEGFIEPTQVMHLGTRTKGATTTIVNLKSKVHVFNDELFKIIQPTKIQELPPQSSSEPPIIDFSSAITLSPKPSQTIYRTQDLESLPKKYFTHFTYFYTIHDQQKTRHSTRAEIVTSTVNVPEPLSTLRLGTTINSDGLISIGSGPETMHLGSRELGGLTTEVNLALNTFIQFEGISNAIVESVPTVIPDSSFKSSSPLPDTSSIHSQVHSGLLSSSFVTPFPSQLTSAVSTPDLPLESSLNLQTQTLTRKPIKLFSSAVIRDPLRSKIDANGRPGVRIRVRPITSSRFTFPRSSVVSSSIEELSSNTNDEIFPTPTFTTPTFATPTYSTPTYETSSVYTKEVESSDDKLTKEVTPTKKRIAVTLRRPFAGNNRISSRRPTRLQLSTVTTKPRFVVVTRTGSVGQLKPTVSNRFKISSRVIKSPVIEKSSPTAAIPITTTTIEEIRPSITVNENGQTLSLTVTTVPVIFGLETSYRTLTFTSTVSPQSTPIYTVVSATPSLPTSAIVTYFTTTTHTVPFTVGDHTIYTTVEETNSRITTELLESVDASDAARANRFTKVSNGVTLIVGSGDSTGSTPHTLQPTLVTGAAVLMKDGITDLSFSDSKSETPQLSLATLYDTRTLFTTFTYFTTFYTDETSLISSSEQTVSNVVTIPYTHIVPSSSQKPIIGTPTVVYETTDRLRTSTVYSTLTYYATLFNGSTSTITPLEEIKTELFTVREPITVTKTIRPSSSSSAHIPSVFTRTYFTTHTNLVTFFHDNTPITSTVEDIESSILTFTVPVTSSSSSSSSSSDITPTAAHHAPMLRTRNTYTTLTHYITLFSGTQTILSSIEEVSPTVVTEMMDATETFRPTHVAPAIQFTRPSQSTPKPSRDIFSALVPSVSTLFTTHTYFTTFFSGTTSTISSREETTSSRVTLFVPQSVLRSDSIQSSPTVRESLSTENVEIITAVSKNIETQMNGHTGHVMFVDSPIESSKSSIRPIQPSLRVESSRQLLESRLMSRVFEGLKSSALSDEQISSVVAEVGASTTVFDGSTIVFFTNFILPTITQGVGSTDMHNIAKGPAGDVISSLLDNTDISILNGLLVSRVNIRPEASSIRETLSPVFLSPVQASDTVTGTNGIKPGSVIELSDLLGGAQIAGNIGEAIKDIVHLFATSPKKNGSDTIDRIGPSKILPPREGVTVSNAQDPIYIPLGAIFKSGETSKAFGKNDIPMPSATVPVVGYTPISDFDRNRNRVPIRGNDNQYRKDDNIMGSITEVPINFEGITVTPQLGGVSLEPSIKTPLPIDSSDVSGRRSSPILPQEKSESDSIKSAVSRVLSGATTIFFTDANHNVPIFRSPNSGSTELESTRYVTSVENSAKTLTLTTTKVYYTRDSPLTITSVLTTTIPPRTFVSTIIGSRTILGTAGESTETGSVQPTQTQRDDLTTTVTTTTLVFNSITTTVVRTLVLPTEIQPTRTAPTSSTRTLSQRPTRKPVPFRPPTRAPASPEIISTKPHGRERTRAPLPPGKPPTAPTRPPVFGVSTTRRTSVKPTIATTRAPIIDNDQCTPACNAANKEICKEFDGKYKCGCRPGFIRKEGSVCHETQSYVVIVRVIKVGESEVSFRTEFTNNTTDEYQNFAKIAKDEIDRAYMTTNVKDNYLGADVIGINQVVDGSDGVIVNFTVHLTKRRDLEDVEDFLRDELSKTLEHSTSESLPNPQSISADVEDVMDFDECSSELFNDCASSARCLNEPGSYRCECKNGYPDLDSTLPGRLCAAEIKSCDFCHGRGDCIRDDSGQVTTCKCHRMYLGRRCEINGLLLATLLPIAAILCIISICCVVYCCRRWRKRTISKGFRNIAAFGQPVIGGTLDRKAMLETSSESSDHMRPHVYEGPGIMPNDPNGSESRRRRGSEPSLDRSMGSIGGAFSSMPPQIVIPRARQSGQQDSLIPEITISGKSKEINERKSEKQSINFEKRSNLYMETGQRAVHKVKPYIKHNDGHRPSRIATINCHSGGENDDSNLWGNDDCASVVSLRSACLITPHASSLSKEAYQKVRHSNDFPSVNYPHGWEWQMQSKPPYTKTSRPGSESALIRNPVSETGRSFDETILHPSTKTLKSDLSFGRSRYARRGQRNKLEGSERSYGYGRNGYADDCFSLNSTMASQRW